MVYFMIEVTEQAAFQIKDMLKDAEDGEKYVRLAVHGGGCSGLSYGLGFEVEPKEDDTVLEFFGVEFVIDKESAPIVKGVKLIINNLCLAADSQLIIQTQSHHADVDHLSVQRRMLVSQKSAKFLVERERPFSDGVQSLKRSFLYSKNQKAAF